MCGRGSSGRGGCGELVDTDNLFFPTHILPCLDSQLREDLLALRQNFSNFTVSTEDQVKALSAQGEGHWAWGLGLDESGGWVVRTLIMFIL